MKQQIEIGRKRQTILLPKIESNSYIESIDEQDGLRRCLTSLI